MGKRIGSYELKTKLGKGTFGTVYLGKHIPSKNKIAIKMINREGLKSEQQSRLEQEILCQRSVNSEYIVSLIDVQKTENNFYLILEFCAGGDLGQFIKSHGPVSESVAQKWIQNLSEGFKVLRSKNIIHRDLKLQNILMTEASTNAVLKLADFGMSRFLGDDLAQTWLGTPLYMAPEMFKTKEGYDSKADVWSLGIVLYEILTGEPPIKAQKREEIPNAQKNLKSIPNHLSPACQDLLRKLLAYDPKERISFEELFTHSFIVKEETKCFSVIESVIKSEAEKSENNTGDDFVLLDDHDSGTDFVFLRPDIHPAVNLSEVITIINQKMSISEIIVKLAQKLKLNKELLGAFALYIKSTFLLEEAVNQSKELIEKHNLVSSSYPLFFDQFEKVNSVFTESKAKTEETCMELEPQVEDQRKSIRFDGISDHNLADNLIFNYSITMCKEAAKDEYLRDYLKAEEKYKEAVILLDFLSNKRDDKNPDWKLFEKFRNETHRRLETVNVKLATA